MSSKRDQNHHARERRQRSHLPPRQVAPVICQQLTETRLGQGRKTSTHTPGCQPPPDMTTLVQFPFFFRMSSTYWIISTIST
jgi:hypothetical protein